MVRHSILTGADLHYPLGHSGAGTLVLASSATAYYVTDASANALLVIDTSTPQVTWGNTTLAATPSHKFILPTSASNGFLIEDYQGNDWLRFNTTAGINLPKAYFGNTTTNPHLEWLGTGAMWLGGSAGTSGQVFTSNGSSAAPSWTSVASAGSSSGTDSLTYTINQDATAALDEDPILYLYGGDGVAAPNDDIVRSYFLQDSSAEIAWFRQDRDRNGAGFTRIAPTLGIGVPSSTSTFGAVLRFDGGGNGFAISETITLSNNSGSAALPLLTISGQLSCPGTGGTSERFGSSALAGGSNDLALGANATTSQAGGGASANMAVGTSSSVGSSGTTQASAIGNTSQANASNTLACGYAAVASAAGACAVGRNSTASAAGAIALGMSASNGLANTCMIGGDGANSRITTFLVGEEDTVATPVAVTFRMTNPTAVADTAAANWVFAAGQGRGTGAGGDIIFQTAAPGTSSAALNALVDVLRLTDTGEVGIGNVGASPASNLHILESNTDTTPAVIIDQDGAGDAAIRFDAGSESWSVGCDNSDSDAFKISESTALGTLDRIWVEANEGSIHRRTHAQADGNASESERTDTDSIQTSGSVTNSVIWSTAIAARDTCHFTVTVTATRRSDEQAKTWKFEAGVYRDSVPNAAAVIGTVTSTHVQGTASTGAWSSTLIITSNNAEVVGSADSGTVEWTTVVRWTKSNY